MPVNKPPAFFWYPKECDTDENVRLMDDAEFGFYMRCLNHAWLNDGLPESMDDIARLMIRPLPKVRTYWKRVGKCFECSGGRWRNPKQEQQRKSVGDYQESRRKAANKRWHPNVEDRTTCKTDAHAMREQCSAFAFASALAVNPKTDGGAKDNRAAGPVPVARTVAKEIPAGAVVSALRQEEFRRVFHKCWKAHGKHDEPMELVEQMMFSRFMDGKLDIALMESRHGPWAEHHTRTGGWRYSKLSFMGWVEAGMPDPPASTATDKAQRIRTEASHIQDFLRQQ